MNAKEDNQPLNPNAATPAELARILGVPEATVQRHVADGAPTAPDGTMSLVHYAAWLNQKLKQHNDGN
jgi:plasmid maintenance system antidote protein VapI